MKKNKVDYKWIIKIIFLSFIISIFFSFISEITIPNLNTYCSILVAILFVLIGVLFDMIGVAVTTSDISVFNSMASKKIKGAKTAIKLKKNADKVSSFCNDVVGDICGIVSGSTGAVIAIQISNKFNLNNLLVTLIVMGIISAMTIGGKAMEKGFAIKKSEKIFFMFAKALSIFEK